jgi:hypothetical protein
VPTAKFLDRLPAARVGLLDELQVVAVLVGLEGPLVEYKVRGRNVPVGTVALDPVGVSSCAELPERAIEVVPSGGDRD